MKNELANVTIFPSKNQYQKVLTTSLVLLIVVSGLSIWASQPVNINIEAVIDNDPVGLRVFAPSIAVSGQSIDINVQAWDKFERLVGHYSSEIQFDSTDTSADLPEDYRFIASSFIPQGLVESRYLWVGDKGMHEFSVTFNSPGIHYVFVTDSNGIAGMSNPVMVYDTAPDEYLYWGDIHGHSARCDGSGTLLEDITYARDIAMCDFAAITTHDLYAHPTTVFLDGALWKTIWDNQVAVINQYNSPNEFVLLQSWEYSADSPQNVGDLCIYSRGSEIPITWSVFEEYQTPDLLFDGLRDWELETGIEVMAIPHHTAHATPGLTYDWSYYDPEFIPLVEIYSVHGSSEMPTTMGNRYPLLTGATDFKSAAMNKSGYYVQDGLAMGYKFGIMASGDSHDGHIGHSIQHTSNHNFQGPLSWTNLFGGAIRANHHYANGMVAVRAPSLTREGVFDSLWSRSCYGARGVGRPYLDFSINGVQAGEDDSTVYLFSENDTRTISFTVACGGGTSENTIERIQIYKNNILWFDQEINDRVTTLILNDTATVAGLYYDQSLGEWRDDGQFYVNEYANNPIDPALLNTDGFDVYYGKMYDTEGGVAWIGPIWVGT